MKNQWFYSFEKHEITGKLIQFLWKKPYKNPCGTFIDSSQILPRFWMPFRHILAAKEHPKSMKIQAGAWRDLWRRLVWDLGSLWNAFRGSGGGNWQKILQTWRNARGPSLSRDLDRVRQTCFVTPCSTEGGRRILPNAPAPKCWPCLASKIASKFSLDFWSHFGSENAPKNLLKWSYHQQNIHQISVLVF